MKYRIPVAALVYLEVDADTPEKAEALVLRAVLPKSLSEKDEDWWRRWRITVGPADPIL